MPFSSWNFFLWMTSLWDIARLHPDLKQLRFHPLEVEENLGLEHLEFASLTSWAITGSKCLRMSKLIIFIKPSKVPKGY